MTKTTPFPVHCPPTAFGNGANKVLTRAILGEVERLREQNILNRLKPYERPFFVVSLGNKSVFIVQQPDGKERRIVYRRAPKGLQNRYKRRYSKLASTNRCPRCCSILNTEGESYVCERCLCGNSIGFVWRRLWLVNGHARPPTHC